VVWSSSVFSGGAAANIVYLAPAADPCNPTCRITLFGTFGCGGAPLGPITGLAYDDGTDQIYATDGHAVLRATFVPPCVAIQFQCCAAPLVAPWYGLCLEPDHPAVVGRACLEPACGSCTALALGTLGDPTLGNASFALRVGGGPVGAVAVPMLHPGACGVGVPFLCGLYHLAVLPPALILPPAGLAGTTACGGAATFALPIPMDPALWGSQFCAQVVVVCLPAGLGLTNALGLRILDS